MPRCADTTRRACVVITLGALVACSSPHKTTAVAPTLAVSASSGPSSASSPVVATSAASSAVPSAAVTSPVPAVSSAPASAEVASPTPTKTARPSASPKPRVVPTTPSPSASASPSVVPTPSPVAGQPLAGKVVVLDPGHNLNNSASINQTVYAGNGVYNACDTTGTSTNAGYPEHAFTFDVATRAAALLRAEGATVVMTRPNDSGIGPCITTRAQIGNDAHANAFIAIHGDGGPAGGHGFFVMQPPLNNPNINVPASAQSRVLATDMHDTFHASTGLPYSTYIANGYYPDDGVTGTINLSHGPVITIECLNMRNSGDAAIATNPTDRQSIAAGIAAGLTAFLTT